MKLQNSLLAMTFLLAGCASNTNSVEALKKWDDRYEECTNLASKNNRPFPVSPWFNSLSVEDQQTVVGYLYNFNYRHCTEQEVRDLREALIHDGNDSLLNIFSTEFTPLEELARDRIQHLDSEEISKLQIEYSEPFNLDLVVEQLKLFP
ncbi:hypothetical protein HC752_23040 [Vibrio sp. S9_S30]|uniref:hypothetical protein n=1 Tax=Vibrio sp. S9_S30 TaxID=2720226 RepID=UPI0016814D8F|nr:hypothetical protein [Vibrio sp. S9_S30]MBD1559812.1 hypothetical protein [Vibrio sp. S9_S30]